MTVLNTWAELLKIYSESRPKIFKALFLTGGLRYTLPVWAIFTALAILLLVHSLQPETPTQALATFAGASLAFFGLILAREQLCAKLYQELYREHSLEGQTFFKRELSLRYVLFKSILQEKGYNSTTTQELIDIAIMAEDPEKPHPISQNLVVVMLFTAVIAISTNLLQLTDTWKENKGALFLFPVIFAIYISFALIDIKRSSKHRSLIIKRYLERAVLDMKMDELNFVAPTLNGNEQQRQTTLN